MKKKLLTVLAAGLVCANVSAQELVTSNKQLDKVFGIATRTLYNNVKDSLINAGGAYGGEWTRDIAINARNAGNLLIPEVTRFSLWSVTTDNRNYIGHQYWDQIIWVSGAYSHYLATQDIEFLKQAYKASKNTMARLEKDAFDKTYGLFTGPSVFNDGIAGYEEPIFEKTRNSSFVGDYPNHRFIKCLSTNCIYYHAYELLARMAEILGEKEVIPSYLNKAGDLRFNIRKYLWDGKNNKFAYLIDQNGKKHQFQEGLGLSFAILFGVVDDNEAQQLIDHAYVAPYGIPSIYPHFKRFSKEKPGRHNVMVWPFVNAFWAEATLKAGRTDRFLFELQSLTNHVLASKDCFYELYNSETGKISGGWQAGSNDEGRSVHDQTWSATGYISMVLRGIMGMEFTRHGLEIRPNVELMNHFGFKEIRDLRYQNGKLRIVKHGNGTKVREIRINKIQAGKEAALVEAPHSGDTTVDIYLN